MGASAAEAVKKVLNEFSFPIIVKDKNSLLHIFMIIGNLAVNLLG